MGNLYDNNRITLDLSIYRIVNVYCVEGDENSRRIIITLTNDGQPFEIDQSMYMSYKVRKPDGNIIHNPITDIIDGKIYIDLDEQCTAKAGIAHASLQLIEIDENLNQSMHSMSFNIIIRESVVSNKEIESTSEFKTLTELIVKAEKGVEDVNGFVEEAKGYAKDAKESADNADASEANAKTSETNAKNSETNAASSATTATEKANSASNSADNAESYAKQSQSYAVGTGNVRENENIDNAKYYYEQSKSISESLSGALKPMGTVAFADLPSLTNASDGDMYNISDQFVTTSDFKEGSGHTIPLGANVYKTFDGYWDILAGTPVTGVKGDAETTYRTGQVNLTAENIGALPISSVDSELSSESTNPVQNKIVANELQDMQDIALAESLGWMRATVVLYNGKYYSTIPTIYGNCYYLVKLNNGAIYRIGIRGTGYNPATGQMSFAFDSSKSKLIIGTDVGLTNDPVDNTNTGKRAFYIGDSEYNIPYPTLVKGIACSTSPDIVSWYCEIPIDGNGTVKDMISNSTAITEKGQYALDAIEKNASVEGTLANQLGTLTTQVSKVRGGVVINAGNALGADYYTKPWLVLKACVDQLPATTVEPLIINAGSVYIAYGYMNATKLYGSYIVHNYNGSGSIYHVWVANGVWYYENITHATAIQI